MAGVSNKVRVFLIEAEIGKQPVWTQDFYRYLIDKGSSPVMAHMLALQQAPMMRESDRSFNESQRRTMNEMPPINRDKIVGLAEGAGVHTSGKYYVGGLGRYTDPAAWVSTSDDVKDVLKARNLNSRGLVSHTATEREFKKVKMGDDVMDGYLHRYAQDPKTKEKLKKKPKRTVNELKEKILATHGTRGG